jgi:hypothetical protein
VVFTSFKENLTRFRDVVRITLVTLPDVSSHLWPGWALPWGQTFLGTPLYAISSIQLELRSQPKVAPHLIDAPREDDFWFRAELEHLN